MTTHTEDYLKDLDHIFKAALKNKNFATALKAKELQAKTVDKNPKQARLSLEALDPETIKALIHDLESSDFPDLQKIKMEIQDIEKNLEKTNTLQEDRHP